MTKRTEAKTNQTRAAAYKSTQDAEVVLKRATDVIRQAGFKITWQLAGTIIANGVTNAEELLAAVATTGAKARARYVPEGTILTLNV